jgi:hypothetical protein
MALTLAERSYDGLLSDKRPNLSAPGTRYSDLYYSLENSSVEVLESTCDWSNVISLTSINFGASNQVNLPMSAFIGQLILHLKLPAPVADESICRGWGLRMLKTIRFQFGSSASTPIILTQQAIWHTLMAECHTAEKRSALLAMCGDGYIGVPGVPTQPPGQDAYDYIEAFVPIPIPFSTVCDKLMYDSTILGQPITVFIDFESSPKAIYGSTIGAGIVHPTAFLAAEMMVRQERLSDTSASLKAVMEADPSMLYAYPFIMSLGYETNGPFSGKQESQGGQVTVQLNQFQNSDLLGIVVSVQLASDITPSGTAPPNPFHCDDLRNIELTYNGAMLFQLPGQSYKAISTYMGDQQAPFYNASYNYLAGNNVAAVASGISEYLLYFDFTRLRSACFQDHMSNTWRIPPGNVLTLKFNTSLDNTNQYRCFYTCFYNAIVTAQGGISNVFTS